MFTFSMLFLVLLGLLGSTSGTPFTNAAENGDLGTLRQMLKADPNLVFEVAEFNRTALFLAAMKGHSKVVKMLIEARSDVDHVDQFLSTPLFTASVSGLDEIVQLLLKSRADVNHKDYLRDSPLIAAAYANRTKTCQILIQAGADVNFEPDFSRNALNYAFENRNDDLIDVLIFNGAGTRYVPRRYGERVQQASTFLEFSTFVKPLPDSSTVNFDAHSTTVEIVEEVVKSLIRCRH
jgi:ankyrin repeat protein